MPSWADGKVQPATVDGLILGRSDDLPAIAETLQDPNPVIRTETIAAVGRFCPRVPGVQAVLRTSLDDKSASVRSAALRVYAQGGESALPELRRMLQDSDPSVANIAEQLLAAQARHLKGPSLRPANAVR